MAISLSSHALSEISRRRLPLSLVETVARNPEQVLPARNGLECRQSHFLDPNSGKEYLLRVIVDPQRDPNLVVTAYKTSKITKYWRK